MRVTESSRRGRRLWLLWPLMGGALLIEAAVWSWAATVRLAFPLDAISFLGWAPPYLLLVIFVLQRVGARLEWRFDLANDSEHRVEAALYPSMVPPFGRYAVFLDGQKEKEKHEGWTVSDRMEFPLAGTSTHEVAVIVSNTNLWPFRRITAALEIDGQRLAEV